MSISSINFLGIQDFGKTIQETRDKAIEEFKKNKTEGFSSNILTITSPEGEIRKFEIKAVVSPHSNVIARFFGRKETNIIIHELTPLERMISSGILKPTSTLNELPKIESATTDRTFVFNKGKGMKKFVKQQNLVNGNETQQEPTAPMMEQKSPSGKTKHRKKGVLGRAKNRLKSLFQKQSKTKSLQTSSQISPEDMASQNALEALKIQKQFENRKLERTSSQISLGPTPEAIPESSMPRSQSLPSIFPTIDQPTIQPKESKDLESTQIATLRSQIPALKTIESLRKDEYGSVYSLGKDLSALINADLNEIGNLEKEIAIIILNQTKALAKIKQTIQQIDQGQLPLTDKKSGELFPRDVVQSVLNNMKADYAITENGVKEEVLRASNLLSLFTEIKKLQSISSPKELEESEKKIKKLHETHTNEEKFIAAQEMQRDHQARSKGNDKTQAAKVDPVAKELKKQIKSLGGKLEKSNGKNFEKVLETKIETTFTRAMKNALQDITGTD
ncbi:MAG: hypothetical protein LBN94_01330 [Puniceicoccales bacterium]|jgi:hypothetical protein|nr:hypothetical protein [Puniceicoccales bacterium]